MSGLFFYLFATLAVIAALLMITRRDAVSSAFWLIFCFLNVAALFATLSAHLMAVLQILIYAGAIMVFFLFVTMFLGQGKQSAGGSRRWIGALALLTVVALTLSMLRFFHRVPVSAEEVGPSFGSIEPVSELMLGRYLFAFEMTGLLLTVAVIGAVLLARRDVTGMRGTRETHARLAHPPIEVEATKTPAPVAETSGKGSVHA